MSRDIIDKLQMTMDTVNNEDISYIISKAILEHIYKDIEKVTIVDLAEECFTSTSTISRFARSLGFSSFNDLKKVCYDRRHLSKEMLQDNIDVSLFDGKNDKENLINYTESIAKSFEDFAKAIDLDEIDWLVDKIHDSDDIHFYGIQLSALLVNHLQFMFMNMGKYIQFGLTSDKQLYNSKQCDKNSLCIFFSVYGNYFNVRKYIYFEINERNAETVLITQNPNLNVIPQIDHVIYLGKYDSSKNGNYKFMLFIEILLSRYYKKYSKEL